MPTVRLDGMLRQFVPKLTVPSSATTLEGVLDELETLYPRLRNRLRDETRTVRPFVKLFVNGREIPRGPIAGVDLAADDQVDILHSIQGG